MLSYPGYHLWPVHCLCWISHDIVVKRRHCYDKVTSSTDTVSQFIQELLGAYFEIENVVFNGEQEQESIICMRVGSPFVIIQQPSLCQTLFS